MPLIAEPIASARADTAGPVQRLNPLDFPHWDELVTSHPAHTVFHTAAWARVLHEAYAYDPVYFVQSNGKPLTALLPVFEVRSWPQGVRGISLPFTDSCPPIGRDATDLGTLRTAAEDYGAQRGWRYLELRGGWESVSLASRRRPSGRRSPTEPHLAIALPETPASASFYSHALDLRPGPAQLWNAFEGSIRRAVRKAENSGVRVEWSSTFDGMQAYYRLHCDTRRGHGLPPQPFRFFQKLHAHLIAKGRGQIAIAWYAGAPVAAAVFVHSGKRVTYKFGASDATSQQVRGNNLVMWKAIEHYAKLGFDTLDFGRTDFEHEGLRRFKLGWGATEAILHYHRYDLRRGDYVACPNRTTGWHNHVFQHLPIPLSRLIGGALYRYLP